MNRQIAAVTAAALLRHGDKPASAKIGACHRLLHQLDFLRSTLRHNLAAMLACSRTDINNLVRCIHRLLVMLHDNQRIAKVAQMLERFQKLAVVTLMQAYARLVEDIEHARQAAANLRRQTDTLRLTARKRACAAVERQIIKANIIEELQACLNLLQHLLGDNLLALAQLQLCKKLQAVAHRQRRNLTDILAAYQNRQGLWLQAAAMTGRAGSARHELLQILTHSVAESLTVAAL